MFIPYTAGASNGFKKWSEAHAAAKYASQSNEAAPIVPAETDTGSPHAESARSSRPMTYCEHSAVHIRRALRLQEAAEAAPVGFPKGEVVRPRSSIRPNGRFT